MKLFSNSSFPRHTFTVITIISIFLLGALFGCSKGTIRKPSALNKKIKPYQNEKQIKMTAKYSAGGHAKKYDLLFNRLKIDASTLEIVGQARFPKPRSSVIANGGMSIAYFTKSSIWIVGSNLKKPVMIAEVLKSEESSLTVRHTGDSTITEKIVADWHPIRLAWSPDGKQLGVLLEKRIGLLIDGSVVYDTGGYKAYRLVAIDLANGLAKSVLDWSGSSYISYFGWTKSGLLLSGNRFLRIHQNKDSEVKCIIIGSDWNWNNFVNPSPNGKRALFGTIDALNHFFIPWKNHTSLGKSVSFEKIAWPRLKKHSTLVKSFSSKKYARDNFSVWTSSGKALVFAFNWQKRKTEVFEVSDSLKTKLKVEFPGNFTKYKDNRKSSQVHLSPDGEQIILKKGDWYIVDLKSGKTRQIPNTNKSMFIGWVGQN